jgi:4'-phosphopantetheinyl transferase
MIRWLIQSAQDLPNLAGGQTPRGMLCPNEQRDLERLRVPKRRQDWLLGRFTAKRLLCEHLNRSQGIELSFDSVEIRPRPSGAPQAFLRGLPLPLDLSISHSSGQSFCAICEDEGVRIGADLETIEPRSPSFVADYFTDEERVAVRASEARLRDTLVTVIWSAKEAVLKALQLGLTVDTRDICCLPLDWPARGAGWHPLHLRARSDFSSTLRPGARLVGWWTVEGDRVRTLAAIV